MSFFKSLFGGGGEKAPKPGKQAEHKGFMIEAQPYKEGGQYRLRRVISKTWMAPARNTVLSAPTAFPLKTRLPILR